MGTFFFRQRRGFIACLLVLPIAGFMALTAAAQDVAIGLATATVQAALAIVATHSLDFGNVFQGVAKSVTKNTVNSGSFDISGASNAGISIYILLPAYMALPDGSDRMGISFSINDCDIDTALAVAPGDPTAFIDGYPGIDPRNIPATINLGDAGLAAIYLGGKVTPSVDQKPGNYTADIMATVAYNGT